MFGNIGVLIGPYLSTYHYTVHGHVKYSFSDTSIGTKIPGEWAKEELDWGHCQGRLTSKSPSGQREAHNPGPAVEYLVCAHPVVRIFLIPAVRPLPLYHCFEAGGWIDVMIEQLSCVRRCGNGHRDLNLSSADGTQHPTTSRQIGLHNTYSR